jgi:hypothetical protein
VDDGDYMANGGFFVLKPDIEESFIAKLLL